MPKKNPRVNNSFVVNTSIVLCSGNTAYLYNMRRDNVTYKIISNRKNREKCAKFLKMEPYETNF